tara:strand:+ start:523 stop:1056 length:534 start_codon:yes stop_codon:yes gene_type:complete
MNPWEEHPTIWKTKGAFMSYLRGGIRRSLWNRSPVKLEFLKQNRVQIPNPNPKGRVPMVWGGLCALCNELHVLKDIEVDHRTGNHALSELGHLQAFVEAIVCVTFDQLQLVCKPCHKAKSYAEKQGISFEEAKATKIAIELCKTKQDAKWLSERGLIPEKSAPKRRTQIIEVLKEEL